MENTKNILNEILLKMRYDSSKTLSENKKLMEQQQFNPYAYEQGTPEQSTNWYKNFLNMQIGALNLGGELTTYSNLPAWKITNPNSIVYYLVARNGNQRYFQETPDGKTITQKGTWDVVNKKLETQPDAQYRTTKVSDAMMQPSKDEEEKNKKIDQYLKSQTKSSATTTKRKYKPLNDNFVIYSYNKEHIGKLQDCLGMKIKESEKGFFGPKTLAALKNTPQFAAKASKNEPITVAEINAVCGAKELPTLQSKELEKLPAQEPAKAQPATTQQKTQQTTQAKTETKPNLIQRIFDTKKNKTIPSPEGD